MILFWGEREGWGAGDQHGGRAAAGLPISVEAMMEVKVIGQGRGAVLIASLWVLTNPVAEPLAPPGGIAPIQGMSVPVALCWAEGWRGLCHLATAL